MPTLDGLAAQNRRIGNVVLQPIGIDHILLEHFLQVDFLDMIQPLQKPIDFDQVLFQLSAKQRWIEQVVHANPDPRHLIGIRGTDASAGRPDPARPFRLLVRLLNCLMVGKNQMGPAAHGKVTGNPHALALQVIKLFDERHGIDHDAVADETKGAAVQDAGGNQVKDKGAAIIDDGVACVRATLIAYNHIGLTRENIDNFALSLVSPLGSDDYQIGHVRMEPFTEYSYKKRALIKISQSLADLILGRPQRLCQDA